MNFTREPVIETIITPRDGYKLVVRNSKATGNEEYFVDAVELVSFGPALFFRSLERPKNFILPVSDYEVLEVRETRVLLKHPSVEEKPAPKPAASQEEGTKRRRQRRRRGREEKETKVKEDSAPKEEEDSKPSEPEAKEKPKPDFSSLIPPPDTLISENMERYKQESVSEDAESPELPKPELEAKGEEGSSAEEAMEQLSGFSASRFLRKLSGKGDDSSEPEQKDE